MSAICICKSNRRSKYCPAHPGFLHRPPSRIPTRAEWLVETPLSKIKPDGRYMLATRPMHKGGSIQFWCEYLNGKRDWSVKPGIALVWAGKDIKAGGVINNRVMAVEVPAQSARMWRARKHSYTRRMTSGYKGEK